MGERRSVSKPAYVPDKPKETKRDRSWEDEQRSKPGVTTVTYRNIPIALRDAIRDEARGVLFVTVDEFARKLLEAGLKAYQNGEVDVTTTLQKGRLTLFPENEE